MTTSVLLADDHQIFRKGLRLLLEEAADLRVVGEAGDGRTAIDLVAQLTPDVVVMDINMPDVDGIEATRQIVADFPDSRVLALSMHGDERFVEEMLAAGALGYLLKESAPEELQDAIRAVAEGEIFLSAAIQDVVISQYMRNLSGNGLPTTKAGTESRNDAPILKTKLHRPPLYANNVRRTRLLNQLEAGWDRPLALISAPAGYGKSTLVSQWLASKDYPSAWLSLDESDNDLHTFVTYLIAAVETVFPSLMPKTSSMLRVFSLPPIRVLAGTMVNELELAPERFVLVLDDFHTLGDPAIHEYLSELLRYPSKALHLVLATRIDPALDLLLLRSYQRINEIRGGSLNFTEGETTLYLEAVMGGPVDATVAARLTDQTEGWPTGLNLITLSIRDASDLANLMVTLPGERQTLDYLAAEALARQPLEIQSCLLKTSVLKRFCAPLCTTLCREAGESDENKLQGDALIQWTIEKNLFVVALDNSGHWFRYHHLFQEVLQRTLEETLTIAEIDDLRARAGRWFAENDLLDEAIEYALAAHDIDYAVHLVLRNRYALMDAEQWNRLNRWISALPDDAVTQNPLLLSTAAYLNLYRGQVDAAIALCDQAASRPATAALDETARKTVQGEIAVIQAVQASVRGDTRHTYAHIQNALALIPKNALHIREWGIGASAIALQADGQMDQAVELIERTLQARGFGRDADKTIWSRYICIIQSLNGDLTDVQLSAQRCISLSSEPAQVSSLMVGRYFLGASHYLRDELTLAEPHLTAISEDLYSARITFAAHGSIALALLLTAQGRHEQADEVIDRLFDYTIETQSHQTTAIVRAFRVELALRRGKSVDVLRLSALADFDRYPLIWFFYIPQFTEVKLLLAQKTSEGFAQAGAKLDRIEEFLRKNHRKFLLIGLLALKALCLHAQGRNHRASEALTEALTLAERNGSIRNFIDLGEPMADLISHLRDQSVDARLIVFCEQILAGFRTSIPVSHDLDQAEMVESLTERELQTLRLLATELDTSEIAEQLVVTVSTVRTHTKSIYSKLDAHSRFEAVNRAQSLGII